MTEYASGADGDDKILQKYLNRVWSAQVAIALVSVPARPRQGPGIQHNDKEGISQYMRSQWVQAFDCDAHVYLDGWPQLTIVSDDVQDLSSLERKELRYKYWQINVSPALAAFEVEVLGEESTHDLESRIRNMLRTTSTKSFKFKQKGSRAVVVVRMMSAALPYRTLDHTWPFPFTRFLEETIEVGVSAERIQSLAESYQQSLSELLESELAYKRQEIAIVDSRIAEARTNACLLQVRLLTEQDRQKLVAVDITEILTNAQRTRRTRGDTAFSSAYDSESVFELGTPQLHNSVRAFSSHNPISTPHEQQQRPEELTASRKQHADAPVGRLPTNHGTLPPMLSCASPTLPNYVPQPIIDRAFAQLRERMEQRRDRCAYVIWSVETCGLHREDELPRVLQNIDTVLQYAAGFGFDPQNEYTPVKRIICMRDVDMVLLNAPQYKDVQKHATVALCHPHRVMADFIANEIDKIDSRHKGDSISPLVCVISNARQLSQVTQKQQSEDVLIIHNNESMLSTGLFQVKWSAVRNLHKMPLAEQLRLLPVPPHFRLTAHDFLTHRSSVPLRVFEVLTYGGFRLSAVQYRYESTFAVLRELRDIGWISLVGDGLYDTVTGRGLKLCNVYTAHVDLAPRPFAKFVERYIVPKLRSAYGAENPGGIFGEGHVELDLCDVDGERNLNIHCMDQAYARRVAQEVNERLLQLQRTSRTIPLEGWSHHHADVFEGSEFFDDIERQHGVLLIVHRKTVVIEGEKPVGRKQTQKTTIGYVEVEVCYEAREEAAAALDAVAQLEAQTLTLQLFNTELSEITPGFVQELREMHAVRCEVSSPAIRKGSKDTEIILYGFGNRVREALKKVDAVLCDIRIEKQFCTPSTAGFEYLVAFLPCFQAFLRTENEVDLLLLSESTSRKFAGATNGSSSKAQQVLSQEENTLVQKLVIKGKRGSVQTALAYLEGVVACLVARGERVVVRNSINLKQMRSVAEEFAHRNEPKLVTSAEDPIGRNSPPLVHIKLTPAKEREALVQYPLSVCFALWAHSSHSDAITALREELRRIADNFRHALVEYPVKGLKGLALKQSDNSGKMQVARETGAPSVQSGVVQNVIHILERPETAVSKAKLQLDETTLDESPLSEIVYWPDSALPYVLLGPEHKTALWGELRQVISPYEGVQPTIPFRDKDYPTAMRFIGPPDEVRAVVQSVVDLKGYAERIWRFCLLVTNDQRERLAQDSFRRIKALQRQFGVFCNLCSEHSECASERYLGGVDSRKENHTYYGEVTVMLEAAILTKSHRPSVHGSHDYLLRVLECNAAKVSEHTEKPYREPDNSFPSVQAELAKIFDRAVQLDQHTLSIIVDRIVGSGEPDDATNEAIVHALLELCAAQSDSCVHTVELVARHEKALTLTLLLQLLGSQPAVWYDSQDGDMVPYTRTVSEVEQRMDIPTPTVQPAISGESPGTSCGGRERTAHETETDPVSLCRSVVMDFPSRGLSALLMPGVHVLHPLSLRGLDELPMLGFEELHELSSRLTNEEQTNVLMLEGFKEDVQRAAREAYSIVMR